MHKKTGKVKVQHQLPPEPANKKRTGANKNLTIAEASYCQNMGPDVRCRYKGSPHSNQGRNV